MEGMYIGKTSAGTFMVEVDNDIMRLLDVRFRRYELNPHTAFVASDELLKAERNFEFHRKSHEIIDSIRGFLDEYFSPHDPDAPC